MRCWIVLAVLGLAAPAARADHHGMDMQQASGDHDSFGASVSLLAASYSTTSYIGDYQGVIPAASWSSRLAGAGVSVPLYHLVENGRDQYGLGDVVVHGQVTALDEGDVHAGAMLAISAPTGDHLVGLGMGHVMAMPALWGAWNHGRVGLSASAGYSRAITTDDMAHHDHGVWPLVEPMNQSELTWSASADVGIAYAIHAGARLSGGAPIALPGIDRVVGALRVAWGTSRVATAAELQAGLAGDPFTVRGLVETAVHF